MAPANRRAHIASPRNPKKIHARIYELHRTPKQSTPRQNTRSCAHIPRRRIRVGRARIAYSNQLFRRRSKYQIEPHILAPNTMGSRQSREPLRLDNAEISGERVETKKDGDQIWRHLYIVLSIFKRIGPLVKMPTTTTLFLLPRGPERLYSKSGKSHGENSPRIALFAQNGSIHTTILFFNIF